MTAQRLYLIYPIRIENSETAQLASCALLRNALEVTLGFQLGDPLIDRLSIYDTLHKTADEN